MDERTNNEMENLSIQSKNRSPRDLLQRFMVGSAGDVVHGRSDPEEDLGSGEEVEVEVEAEAEADVELNLGLSLGGRFGVDKSAGTLIRSSSIAAMSPVARADDALGGGGERTAGARAFHSGLARTASLPVATEEEWRKRKELQSLRRMAAKRRRSEKQRNLPRGEREESVGAMRHGSSKTPPLAAARRLSGGATDAHHGGSAAAAAAAAEPQGSMSGFESSHLQGFTHKCSLLGSSGSGCETSSLLEQSSQDAGSSGSNPEPESSTRDRGKERRSYAHEDMPCVFTKGDGPNGRRIEGILYKYGKGEQVKIM